MAGFLAGDGDPFVGFADISPPEGNLLHPIILG